MHRRSISIIHLTLGAVPALWLGACAGDGSAHSGRRILDELAASGVDVRGDSVGAGALTMEARSAALPESGVTLADLIDAAEATHPRLAAARARVGVAAGRAWQASLYPNPTIGVGIEDIGFDDGLDGSKSIVSFSQPIVAGERLRAAVDAAEAEQRVRLAEVESERRRLFADVATLHATLLSIAAQEAALGASLESARGTLEIAVARVEARAASEPEALRPRIEIAQVESELLHLGAIRRAAESRLGLLVGVESVEASRLAGALDDRPAQLDAEVLSAALRDGHPELAAMALEAEAARSRIALVESRRTPDLEVRVGAGYDDASTQGVVELGVGAEVPLWDRGEGDLLAARFDVLRAEQERAALEQALQSELTQLLAEYDSARSRLELLRTRVLPDADLAFAQISESYRAGRAAFLELLDAQRTTLEARRSAASLAGDAASARASIARIVGARALAKASGESELSIVEPESHSPIHPEVSP